MHGWILFGRDRRQCRHANFQQDQPGCLHCNQWFKQPDFSDKFRSLYGPVCNVKPERKRHLGSGNRKRQWHFGPDYSANSNCRKSHNAHFFSCGTHRSNRRSRAGQHFYDGPSDAHQCNDVAASERGLCPYGCGFIRLRFNKSSSGLRQRKCYLFPALVCQRNSGQWRLRDMERQSGRTRRGSMRRRRRLSRRGPRCFHGQRLDHITFRDGADVHGSRYGCEFYGKWDNSRGRGSRSGPYKRRFISMHNSNEHLYSSANERDVVQYYTALGRRKRDSSVDQFFRSGYGIHCRHEWLRKRRANQRPNLHGHCWWDHCGDGGRCECSS